MKKDDYKHTPGLTLLLSIIIFITLFITIALTAILGYIAVTNGFGVGIIDNNSVATKSLLLILLVSLVAGSIISVIASKIISKPVGRMITQMNRLASGDFKTRLNFGKLLQKNTVLSAISESFNKMAGELDDTELLRKDFINNFSHEFKTPIVSIAGFAKLLKKGNLTEEQRIEYLDAIEEESMRLSEMATNVLNMTKVENQTILSNTNVFNLSEQIRSSFLLLENKWSKKNIEFDLEFDEYFINANEEMLKQVWINLIDNAIKFTPDYGTVRVKITEKEKDFIVSVINHGSEISPENQVKIFNKFYQEDESHSTEGNGIGLAVVKKIVELHKGEILVNSKNNTTTFTVRLPKNSK